MTKDGHHLFSLLQPVINRNINNQINELKLDSGEEKVVATDTSFCLDLQFTSLGGGAGCCGS